MVVVAAITVLIGVPLVLVFLSWRSPPTFAAVTVPIDVGDGAAGASSADKASAAAIASPAAAVVVAPHDIAAHRDMFFDVFPLNMTREMHQRTLYIRRVLRQEEKDLDRLRAPVRVHNAVQLGQCHARRNHFTARGGVMPSQATADPSVAEMGVPILTADVFTDGMGALRACVRGWVTNFWLRAAGAQ